LKASRAYIAGLGTSGVLIGSFLLLLAVVSAIVAFRGAPGEASNEGLDRLDLSASRQASKATGAPRSAGEGARDAPARGDRAGARGTTRRARVAGTPGRRAGGVSGERVAGGLAGVGDATGPSHAGGNRPDAGGLTRLPVDPRRPGGIPSAPTVGDVATGLGDAVEDTTDNLGGTVGGAVPPLEAPIVRTGEAAAGVVHQAAPVVDQTVERVTGTVGGVTDRVTGVTDQVAGGLGGGGGN
jgi:hypothetical protein